MDYAAPWQPFKLAFAQIEILERYGRPVERLFDILETTRENYELWKKECPDEQA